MPDICHAFRQQFPEVRFNIRLGEPLSLLKLLQQGDIDFAVIDLVLATMQAMGGSIDLYSIEPLIDEELTLISSEEYYNREIAGDHSYDTLIGKEFVSDEHDDMFLKHWFFHHFKKGNVRPNVVLTVENHQACLRCVKLGMGLTTTSSHMVWKEIAAGTIVPVTTGTPNAINTISLVELQDKVPTVTEKTFSTHIRQAMRQDSMLRRFNILPSA
jgi:DNA-binding transcriptional LysR family regulator